MKRRIFFKTVALFCCLLPWLPSVGQQSTKVQDAIASIKEAYYSEDQDYHTDGQRTVWVKSYKKWLPEDFSVMKKEAPPIFAFLRRAADRSRYDVLEQLLPNFYRENGGVKAFASDILKQTMPPKSLK